MMLSLAVATILLGGGVWLAFRGSQGGTTHSVSSATLADSTQVPVEVSSTPSSSVTPSSLTPSTAAMLPVPDSPTLRPDGVGDARFGMSFEQVNAILMSLFGTPSFDDQSTGLTPALLDNSSPDPDGFYSSWLDPVFRRTCWGGASLFCLSFSGDRAETLVFVGWDYVGAELELADARGVTVGTKWRDVQAQFARPTHGCQYQAQAVSNDGILALLRSSAPIFGDHCSDRQPMAAPDLPDMASVVISGLRAGRMVGHVPAD
jgi:hypothetical protein